MKENNKNNKQSPKFLIKLAHLMNRDYFQQLGHFTFLSILLIFQCSIQICIFNSFFSSIDHQSYFKEVINKIYSCILLGQNSQSSSLLVTNFIRFSGTLLISFNIILILLLKKSQNTQTNMLKLVKNISKTTITFQLQVNIILAYFSAYQLFNYSFSIFGILDYFNILFIIISIYCFEKFAIQVEYDSKKSVLSTFNQNNAFLKICKTIIACILVRKTQYRPSYIFLLYLLVFVLNLIKLRQILTYRKYIGSFYQQITEIITSIGFTTSFLTLLFVPFQIQLIDNNIGVIFCIVAFLFYHSFSIYVKFKRNQLFLNGFDAVRNQQMAISYILQLIKIQQIDQGKIDNQKNLLITLILEDHVNYCRNLICICQNGEKQQNKCNLIKLIIMDLIKKICNKFPSSFSLKLIQIGYKLLHSPKIISLSLEIQNLIKLSKFKDLSFQSKFILQEFTYKIERKYNEYKKLNRLNCQNIFVEQSIKSQVSQLIIDLINITIEKYKLLSIDFYSLNLIEEYSMKINTIICNIQDLWAKVRKINSFNFQIYQIFIFHYKNIVISRIQARHMAEEINSKLQKISLLKKISKQSANKYIYSKKTCIIESFIEQSFGIISNITSNCNDILGIPKQHLLNKSINESMADYFAKGHQQAMDNWLQNCEISTSNEEMIQFGFVDLKNYCFQGYLFMKVLSSGQKLLFYSMVVRQNDYDYFLLNNNLQIEGIGKRFIKQEILNMSQIKHHIQQYSDFSIEDNMKIGSKTKSKIVFQKEVSSVKAYQTNKQISARSFQKNILKYQCSVIISKYGIGKRQYFLIKLQSVTKWLSAQSCKQIKIIKQKQLTTNYIKKSIEKDEDFLIKDQYESLDSYNPARYTRINTIQNSSLSDDSGEIYSYNNFIFNVKKYLIHPEIVSLSFYKKNTFALILICAILIILVFSLRTVFVEGFKSFNDVMFGDGAVSDNNQILQMLYNNVLMSRTYCQNQQTTERCNYLINSTIIVSNILYDLYVSDLQVYLINKTSLSKLKFYQSYDVPVIFTMGNTSQQISTLQFMQYYYYAIYQQNRLISQGKKWSKQAKDVMGVLLDNWQQMKFINHNAIYFYLAAGEKELNMLNGYLLMLVGGVYAFLILLGLTLNKYYDYLHTKKMGIFSIYQEINIQLGKDMVTHYQTLKEFIVTNQFPLVVIAKIQNEEHQYRKKQNKYHRNKCYFIQIIFVLIVLMLFAGLQFLQVSLIIPPCKDMVYTINNLMDSQNYLLQSYFELKTYYLQYDFGKSVDQISQQISTQLNSSQPMFTSMAKKSINLFKNDPTFTQDFNILLVVDTCNLTASLFQQWQISYCYNHLDPVLTLGLMNGMTYFYRNSFQALNQLKRRQYQKINTTAYFKQQVFQDIDDSLFYMFRLYQATQTRMYIGLNYIVNSSLFLLDVLNTLSTIILAIIILWSLYSFNYHQKQLSNLYGMVLQFPQIVMKKTVISTIKDYLQIKI